MLALTLCITYILIYYFNFTLICPGSSFVGQLSFLKVKCQPLLQKVIPPIPHTYKNDRLISDETGIQLGSDVNIICEQSNTIQVCLQPLPTTTPQHTSQNVIYEYVLRRYVQPIQQNDQ